METKEKLEAQVIGLKDKIQELQCELTNSERSLSDVNKPELTQSQLDYIIDAINGAINNTSFEPDSFDYDFGIESDGQVYISHVDYTNQDQLEEDIVEYIHGTFKIVDESDDNA